MGVGVMVLGVETLGGQAKALLMAAGFATTAAVGYAFAFGAAAFFPFVAVGVIPAGQQQPETG